MRMLKNNVSFKLFSSGIYYMIVCFCIMYGINIFIEGIVGLVLACVVGSIRMGNFFSQSTIKKGIHNLKWAGIINFCSSILSFIIFVFIMRFRLYFLNSRPTVYVNRRVEAVRILFILFEIGCSLFLGSVIGIEDGHQKLKEYHYKK